MQNRTAAMTETLIAEKRAYLAALAAEGRIGDLARTVNEIAALEGAHLVRATDERSMVNGLETDERLEVLTDLLLRGADDTWSGRTNDVNRAHFDGIRETASVIMRRLRY